MKADKLLSEGGATSLMFLSGLGLLTLLFVNPVATSCAGFATAMLILMPKMCGKNCEAHNGLTIAAGLPILVGFFASIPVFFLTMLFTWWLLLGLAWSGAIERQITKKD